MQGAEKTEQEERKMYPYTKILYKTDNSGDWHIGIIGCEKEQARKFSEGQKKKNITAYCGEINANNTAFMYKMSIYFTIISSY